MTYEQLLRKIYESGHEKGDRTGTGTRSLFGHQIRYDLNEGFPLITSKRVPFKAVAIELLWFLKGHTNVGWLQSRGVHIWDEWADEAGDLGPVYGKQWREWEATKVETGTGWTKTHHVVVDQITDLVNLLKHNPDSRRMLVSAWNPVDVPYMKLPPCHFAFQCYVAGGRLSLQVYQRSADMFLGVPFNLASYALLCHMLAQQCDLDVGELVWTGGDCHVYNNHFEQVEELLSRSAKPMPRIHLDRAASIFDYDLASDIHLLGYDPHPAIAAPVAV
jgi:thymidylate synthase